MDTVVMKVAVLLSMALLSASVAVHAAMLEDFAAIAVRVHEQIMEEAAKENAEGREQEVRSQQYEQLLAGRLDGGVMITCWSNESYQRLVAQLAQMISERNQAIREKAEAVRERAQVMRERDQAQQLLKKAKELEEAEIKRRHANDQARRAHEEEKALRQREAEQVQKQAPTLTADRAMLIALRRKRR